MTTIKTAKPKLTPEQRRQRVKDLYEYQIDAFQKLGISDPIYIPKMAYVPNGKDERHIAFFGNELEKCENSDIPEDIYTEFVSMEYLSEDTSRSLYKWKFNPHWRTEYDIIPATDVIQERYMIPVSELRLMYDNTERLKTHKYEEETTIVTQNVDLFDVEKPFDSEEDSPLKDLTIRDIVSIFTGRPVSNKPWLNQLLKEINNK